MKQLTLSAKDLYGITTLVERFGPGFAWPDQLTWGQARNALKEHIPEYAEAIADLRAESQEAAASATRAEQIDLINLKASAHQREIDAEIGGDEVTATLDTSYVTLIRGALENPKAFYPSDEQTTAMITRIHTALSGAVDGTLVDGVFVPTAPKSESSGSNGHTTKKFQKDRKLASVK